MHRPITAAAGAALAAVLLAGCASGSAESSESDTATPTVTPEATEGSSTSADEDDGLAEGAVRPDRTPSASAPEDGPRTISPNARGPYDDGSGPERATPIVCSDGEAIRANEGHEPAGWPAGVSEGEDLPDPECHPDFIELPAWEHYHSSCMHTVAHGTLASDEELEAGGAGAMGVQERRSREWEASEIRAWWTPPAEGEPCLGHDGDPDGEVGSPESD